MWVWSLMTPGDESSESISDGDFEYGGSRPGWTDGFSVKMCRCGWKVTELTQRPWQIGTARDVIKVLTLHLLLIRFEVIKVVEIAHDNRLREKKSVNLHAWHGISGLAYHGKRNGQHTSDSAKWSHNFPPNSDRGHITVSNCCLLRKKDRIERFEVKETLRDKLIKWGSIPIRMAICRLNLPSLQQPTRTSLELI